MSQESFKRKREVKSESKSEGSPDYWFRLKLIIDSSITKPGQQAELARCLLLIGLHTHKLFLDLTVLDLIEPIVYEIKPMLAEQVRISNLFLSTDDDFLMPPTLPLKYLFTPRDDFYVATDLLKLNSIQEKQRILGKRGRN